jgi:hypothetical protein
MDKNFYLPIILVITFFVIKVIEEVMFRKDTKGYLPNTSAHLTYVRYYLKKCKILSASAIFVDEPDKEIKYITSVLKSTTFKWIIVGETHRYLVPRWSQLHKEIEAKYLELKYNQESNLF